MTIVEDTLLAVHDIGNGRVVFYEPFGRVRSAFPVEIGFVAADNRVANLVSDRAGLIWLLSTSFPPQANGRPVPPMSYYRRYRRDGVLIDSVSLPAPVFDNDALILSVRSADGAMHTLQPQFFATASPSGVIAFGRSDAMRFGWLRPGADVHVVERDWKPEPVSPREYENWRAITEDARAEMKRRGEPVNISLPGVKPAYRNLSVDADGRIWVSVSSASVELPASTASSNRPRLEWTQPLLLDVFSATGSYLGRVALPAGTELLYARGSRVWVLEQNGGSRQITAFALSTRP